jgi:hypothetical protein
MPLVLIILTDLSNLSYIEAFWGEGLVPSLPHTYNNAVWAITTQTGAERLFGSRHRRTRSPGRISDGQLDTSFLK